MAIMESRGAINEAVDVKDRLRMAWYPPGVLTLLGAGTTCFVGLLDDGHVLKYSKENGTPSVELITEEAIYTELGTHPYILRFLGRTQYGLKFARGRPLCDQIETAEHVTRIKWSHQCAVAMAYFHSHGVLHCDFHPNNLLLDDNNNIQVSDFQGKYKEFDGGALEAIRYALPGADEPSVRTDIFALGSTVYWIMTGRHPYEDAADAEIPKLFAANESPATTFTGLSIVQRCWQQRYQAAEELVSDLSSLA